MRQIYQLIIAFLTLFAFSIVAYSASLAGYGFGGLRFADIQNLFFILFSFIAFAAAALNIRIFGVKAVEGRVWLFLTIGMLFWFLSEAAWFVNQSLFGITPFPSMSVLFFGLGFLFLFAALLTEFSIIKALINPPVLLYPLVLSVFFALPSFFSSIVPFITAPQYAGLPGLLSALFPLADILLFFLALVIITVFWGSRASVHWTIIGVSLAFFAVADSLFPHLELSRLYYQQFFVLDLLWFFAYLLFAFGALIYRGVLRGRIYG